MEINPITIWKDGVEKVANKLLLHIEYDNMEDRVRFFYRLCNQDEENISAGYLEMMDDEYTSWDGNNNFAYIWAVNKLNLSIIE
jgi:hypothetical protein